ncbi:MAG: hypothetical protein HQL13_08055 [Candidatus Omnitrophica bacterium]|nr:hypothetical protein [Candidatus Omnitrophota bacterium]
MKRNKRCSPNICPASAQSSTSIDEIAFDTRPFTCTRDDVKKTCSFFQIGKLQTFEIEKDVAISHTNFFVFVKTSQGAWGFKFYPRPMAKSIGLEYALNHFLVAHHFPTPLMRRGMNKHPFIATNNMLATCFAYIKGQQVWQKINQKTVITQINSNLVTFKKHLSSLPQTIPLRKAPLLTNTIHSLIKTAHNIKSFSQQKFIMSLLRKKLKQYQEHKPLYIRRYLHNNASLTNFLVDKTEVYTLDLSHVCEDYHLADLASLVISCLFFNVPQKIITTIEQDYFIQNKLKGQYACVLNTLVTIGLIQEYLKNSRREISPAPANCPKDVHRHYLKHLTERQKIIFSALKNPSSLEF